MLKLSSPWWIARRKVFKVYGAPRYSVRNFIEGAAIG